MRGDCTGSRHRRMHWRVNAGVALARKGSAVSGELRQGYVKVSAGNTSAFRPRFPRARARALLRVRAGARVS